MPKADPFGFRHQFPRTRSQEPECPVGRRRDSPACFRPDFWRTFCLASGTGPRRFVYIVRSDVDPGRHYTGITGDVARRLEWHNHGPSGVTMRHRPWRLVVAVEFTDVGTAVRFERYLKSGSGRAFVKRHFGALPVHQA